MSFPGAAGQGYNEDFIDTMFMHITAADRLNIWQQCLSMGTSADRKAVQVSQASTDTKLKVGGKDTTWANLYCAAPATIAKPWAYNAANKTAKAYIYRVNQTGEVQGVAQEYPDPMKLTRSRVTAALADLSISACWNAWDTDREFIPWPVQNACTAAGVEASVLGGWGVLLQPGVPHQVVKQYFDFTSGDQAGGNALVPRGCIAEVNWKASVLTDNNNASLVALGNTLAVGYVWQYAQKRLSSPWSWQIKRLLDEICTHVANEGRPQGATDLQILETRNKVVPILAAAMAVMKDVINPTHFAVQAGGQRVIAKWWTETFYGGEDPFANLSGTTPTTNPVPNPLQ